MHGVVLLGRVLASLAALRRVVLQEHHLLLLLLLGLGSIKLLLLLLLINLVSILLLLNSNFYLVLGSLKWCSVKNKWSHGLGEKRHLWWLLLGLDITATCLLRHD